MILSVELPYTCNALYGLVVPIPTLPVVSIVEPDRVEKDNMLLALSVFREILFEKLRSPFVLMVNTVPMGAMVPSVL
jgi:hypothetical protein